MKQSRFSEEQKISILKEAEGEPVKTVCARHNISETTYYHWKNKYGGMEVEEARRLRVLEKDNARRKRDGREPGRRGEGCGGRRSGQRGPGLSGSWIGAFELLLGIDSVAQ
jgi:putative transposase